VNTAPDNPAAAGAEVGSNNTAEVQALIELLDDILISLPTDTTVVIYTDSQYAHDAMPGLSVPSTHTYMIRTLQKLYFAAKQRF
jgi:ribonuclease HI